MKIHDLIQGSPQWLAYRATMRNASDAPAMMGCSAYKTRAELLREMHTGVAAEVDIGTQMRFDNGHRAEALARPLAEEFIGSELYPVTGSLGNLSASFDGITLAEDECFEHKALNDALRAAFADMRQFAIRRPVTQDATYQIVPIDFWTSLLLTTSGTRTYTLPAWADMPDFVPPLIGKNRSGNNLTLARTGTDTFDAAATSVVVPTGSHWEVYKSDTSGLWETRVFA